MNFYDTYSLVREKKLLISGLLVLLCASERVYYLWW